MVLKKKKGLSLLEMTIVTAAGLTILMFLYQLNITSIKTFTKVKSISDSLGTEAPTSAVIDKYFERWGIGIYADGQDELDLIANPLSPPIIYPLKTARTFYYEPSPGTSNPCDKIEFYGNLGGYGFVDSISANQANLIGCNLQEKNYSHCFQVFRSSVMSGPFSVVNGVDDNTSSSSINASLGNIFSSNAADLSCSEGNIFDAPNNKFKASYQVDTTNMSNFVFETDNNATLQEGDLLFNAPNKITFECKKDKTSTFDDGGTTQSFKYNGWWLYVKVEPISIEKIISGNTVSISCNPVTPNIPNITEEAIAPVDSFEIKQIDGSDISSVNKVVSDQSSGLKIDISLRQVNDKNRDVLESYKDVGGVSQLRVKTKKFSKIYGVN